MLFKKHRQRLSILQIKIAFWTIVFTISKMMRWLIIGLFSSPKIYIRCNINRFRIQTSNSMKKNLNWSKNSSISIRKTRCCKVINMNFGQIWTKERIYSRIRKITVWLAFIDLVRSLVKRKRKWKDWWNW